MTYRRRREARAKGVERETRRVMRRASWRALSLCGFSGLVDYGPQEEYRIQRA